MSDPENLHLLGLCVGELRRWCEDHKQETPEIVLAPAPPVRKRAHGRSSRANPNLPLDEWRVAQALTLADGRLQVVAVLPIVLNLTPPPTNQGLLC